MQEVMESCEWGKEESGGGGGGGEGVVRWVRWGGLLLPFGKPASQPASQLVDRLPLTYTPSKQAALQSPVSSLQTLQQQHSLTHLWSAFCFSLQIQPWLISQRWIRGLSLPFFLLSLPPHILKHRWVKHTHTLTIYIFSSLLFSSTEPFDHTPLNYTLLSI